MSDESQRPKPDGTPPVGESGTSAGADDSPKTPPTADQPEATKAVPAGPSAAEPAAAKPAAAEPAAAKPAAAKPAAKPAKLPPGTPTAPPDPEPPEDVTVPSYLSALRAALPEAVTQVSYWVGDWTVIVPADRLLEVARWLRDTPPASFDYCSDLTASDWPARPQRFDVIYCLYSTTHRHRVRLKVRAAEGEGVPSVVELWPAANWLEREVYDMFGVNLVGHPDRRRILMPDEWQGHPQRKDYPLEGPGELLMENPLDWLKLRNAEDEAEIE